MVVCSVGGEAGQGRPVEHPMPTLTSYDCGAALSASELIWLVMVLATRSAHADVRAAAADIAVPTQRRGILKRDSRRHFWRRRTLSRIKPYLVYIHLKPFVVGGELS